MTSVDNSRGDGSTTPDDVGSGAADGDVYRFVSVERSDAPDNTTGVDWFCYEIGQGSNRIVGYRQGSRRSVEDAIRDIVQRLNERRIGPRGRVHIDMSSRSRPASRKP